VHLLLIDLICCPECRHFPLDLTILEEGGTPDNTCGATCHEHCARDAVSLAEPEQLPCDDCLRVDVETGFLYCAGCGRFYFIIGGIPRLISEEFSDLIDRSIIHRFARAFDDRRRELDTFLAKVADKSTRSDVVQWNLDDVGFWENHVYADDHSTKAAMERVERGQPNAGNRTYPRERTLFRHIRPTLAGRCLLDLGCGLAQTIRVVCNPDEVGYVYIGADLSISALLTNRATMLGEFVQCSVDRLPFRDEAVDVVLTLGTIHHLADHESVVSQIIAVVRPGGLIGLEEVVARNGLTERIGVLAGFHTAESAHNEFVPLDLLQRRLGRAGTIRVLSREYSPIRGVLCGPLGDAMRTRPWLTQVVLVADALCIRTLGRVFPFFSGRSALILAERSSR
jgi:uncharacterized protein YbaR (Trm112 family)/SAM-dependent methyltransferase